MPRWTALHTHFIGNWQAEVELMAMAWRQAALMRDTALNSNLVCNQWNLAGMCSQLDWHGIQPDEITIEWARSMEGYPPPVPFFHIR